MPDRIDLSIVVPVFNERDNLLPLFEEVDETLAQLNIAWELLAVDDGSEDGSGDVLVEAGKRFSWLTTLTFHENRGQTAALFTGWKQARGKIVAALDADLQNDPADLVTLYNRLHDDDGIDLIAGVREERKDSWWKKVQSRIGNSVRNFITGDQVTDTGCSLKVMRRECAADLPMLDGMHRFIPTLVRMRGYEVIEMPVAHRRRRSGVTKYSAGNRAMRGLIDCFAVRWMVRRSRRMRGSRESR